jgi:hypothetical protein
LVLPCGYAHPLRAVLTRLEFIGVREGFRKTVCFVNFLFAFSLLKFSSGRSENQRPTFGPLFFILSVSILFRAVSLSCLCAVALNTIPDYD